MDSEIKQMRQQKNNCNAKCPFQNFLNRLNQLDFKGGGLIRGGVADVDA
jgi:hypothetical protein